MNKIHTCGLNIMLSIGDFAYMLGVARFPNLKCIQNIKSNLCTYQVIPGYMYKNSIENDIIFFEIPALLSYQRGENSAQNGAEK